MSLRTPIGIMVALLLTLPAVAHATAFSTSATIDLTTPPLTAPITPITLAVGDTLSADVSFASSQALQVGNGSSENVTLSFIPTNFGSGSFIGAFSLTLTGLSGEFLPSLPVISTTSGNFLIATVFADLTSSSFTFTGLHVDLTLTDATEPFMVERLSFSASTPNTVVTAAVPEPATLSLLGFGLLSIGVTVLQRLRRNGVMARWA